MTLNTIAAIATATNITVLAVPSCRFAKVPGSPKITRPRSKRTSSCWRAWRTAASQSSRRPHESGHSLAVGGRVNFTHPYMCCKSRITKEIYRVVHKSLYTARAKIMRYLRGDEPCIRRIDAPLGEVSTAAVASPRIIAESINGLLISPHGVRYFLQPVTPLALVA